MRKTNLTITMTGTNELENGEYNVIDEKYENVKAVVQFTFMDADENAHALGVVCVGGFSRQYYVEIIEKLREVMGKKEFDVALMYVKMKEVVKGMVSDDA